MGTTKRGAPHEEGHPVRHSTPQHQSTSVEYLKIYLRSSNDVQDNVSNNVSVQADSHLVLTGALDSGNPGGWCACQRSQRQQPQ